MADEKKVATREENLKKINEELEKLSDEELDKVAGGILPFDWRKQNNIPNTVTDSNLYY
jgi:hypothetical protein